MIGAFLLLFACEGPYDVTTAADTRTVTLDVSNPVAEVPLDVDAIIPWPVPEDAGNTRLWFSSTLTLTERDGSTTVRVYPLDEVLDLPVAEPVSGDTTAPIQTGRTWRECYNNTTCPYRGALVLELMTAGWVDVELTTSAALEVDTWGEQRDAQELGEQLAVSVLLGEPRQ